MWTLYKDTQHYKIEYSASTLRFTFPHKKQWYSVLLELFMFIVLISMFYPSHPASPAFTTVLSESIQSPAYLFVLLLNKSIITLLIGIWTLELFWLLMGKEVVEVTTNAILIRHKILGFGISKKYQADKIDGLFASQKKINWWLVPHFGRLYGFFWFKNGKIAVNSEKSFLLGVKTFRFGSILESTEARQIVALIHKRFPQYKYKKR